MRRRHFLGFTAAQLIAGSTAAIGQKKAESDPWPASQILEPEQFARLLSSHASDFSLFYVGFPILYRGAHIRGAVLAGPCSKPEGIAELKAALAKLARDRDVVLYCGCCPFDQCPNIRPAFTTARETGRARLKVLRLATNLHDDWVVKGYPVEKSA